MKSTRKSTVKKGSKRRFSTRNGRSSVNRLSNHTPERNQHRGHKELGQMTAQCPQSQLADSHEDEKAEEMMQHTGLAALDNLKRVRNETRVEKRNR